jgi:segregation and condensation protein A
MSESLSDVPDDAPTAADAQAADVSADVQVADVTDVPADVSLDDVAPPPPAHQVAALAATSDDEAPPAFVVELPEFSGPLDLLLTLIREEQVDIYDIPIARIAQQFLERIHAMRLDAAAEYLEMAARLVRIKAQLLLPRPEGVEGWEDPRAELVRRLLEYQQVREVVDVMERLSDERRNRFARSYIPTPSEPDEPAPGPLSLSLGELFAAIDRVLRQAKRPVVHDVIPRALDVDGAIGAIRRVLELRARGRWNDLVAGDAEPWQILSVLLALLELAKRGELRIAQPKPFASVEFSGDTASEAA